MRIALWISILVASMTGAPAFTEGGGPPYGDADDPLPVAVSPGGADEALRTGSCPGISWGRVDGAVSYELIVVRLDEGSETTDTPVLRQRIPGAATSWTPDLDRCFDPGHRYGWSVRAEVGGRISEWSEPLLFEVPTRPHRSGLELTRSLDDGMDTGANRRRAGSRSGDDEASGGFDRSVQEESPSQAAPIPAGNTAAQIRVVGEVRTVAPDGAARLWGRGRTTEVHGTILPPFGDMPCVNGSISYGLSTTAVDWGSAADACPVGTWVCDQSEVVACNTTRPDSTDDLRVCDGTGALTASDRPQNEHLGWVLKPHDHDYFGRSVSEDGVPDFFVKCTMMPVWCCWE